MSSATVIPSLEASAKKHPAFLKRLGHMGLECVTKVLPFLTREAQRAEPVVDLLFPLEGPIFSSVVNSICLAEAAATQSAASEKTGALKLQAVWNSAGPMLLQLASDHGMMSGDAEANARQYIEALVTLLNGPAKTSADKSPASC